MRVSNTQSIVWVVQMIIVIQEEVLQFFLYLDVSLILAGFNWSAIGLDWILVLSSCWATESHWGSGIVTGVVETESEVADRILIFILISQNTTDRIVNKHSFDLGSLQRFISSVLWLHSRRHRVIIIIVGLAIHYLACHHWWHLLILSVHFASADSV